LFVDVLKYKHWIDDPECGVMSQSAGLVQGGSFSTREQFPWLVSISVDLNNDGKFIHSGSGSLISMKHVLAEALSVCSVQAETKKLIATENNRVKLVLGTLKFNEATTSGSAQINGDSIAEIVVHPDARDEVPNIADIAIIKLKNRLQRSNFISPVCLWTGSDEINQIFDQTSYGVGYGRDESGKNSEIRKHVKMNIKTDSYCNQYWNDRIANAPQSKYFCAKGDGTSTTCNYDDPLYIKMNGIWFIRGLLSMMFEFDNGTCNPTKPMLYEDLAFYKNWIAANMK